MRTTTQIRTWNPGEAAETRTLCYEDQRELCRAATDAVHNMLTDNGIDPLAISVELRVEVREAITPDPPKKKKATKKRASKKKGGDK